MKKTKVLDTDMRPEYDFRGGIRGKYAKRFSEGSNLIVLDPDVATLFPDSKSVNDALRAIAQVAKRQIKNIQIPAGQND
ncbi:MAG: hypothetical protein WBG50_25155 [Desulfomonilaceae bacterium]